MAKTATVAETQPEDVATPEAFERDPEFVWRFYHARRRALKNCRPNPGHFALAELERLVPRFDLITQNVDGLHPQAGSRRVITLHGDLNIDRCSQCRWEGPTETHDDPPPLPRCRTCGGALRPGVVWFGEMLPPEALSAAQAAAKSCQVMLVVGTSSVVQPAASLALWAQQAGAKIIEVNPETTELSPLADLRLNGPSGQVLPKLVDRVEVINSR